MGKTWVKTVVALLAGALLTGGAVLAVGADPGSQKDPLVPKSYVDAKLELEVEKLDRGDRLIADAGTEIIVRGPGEVRAIGSDAGGLSDVTGARDLSDGRTAPPNHLLIVPREDGRGIEARGEVYVMVRGSYEIR